MSAVLHFLWQFFPPDLSLHYLRAELPAIFQTIEIAAAGMLLAIAAGFASGFYVGARLPASGVLYSALIAIRSFPDIVLALLCVVMFGVGSGPGMIAIGTFYGAAIGKIFADLLRAAPRGPVDALNATGATRFSTALFARIPLRRSDLISYAAFEFESAVRAAVIVGAVGGGGLGVELIGTINEFDYRRTCTLILMLVAVVGLLDQLAQLVKRRPVLLIPALPLMALALYRNWPEMVALQHAVEAYRKMLPPTLTSDAWSHLAKPVFQTLEIAVVGTLVACLAALPLALCAARTLAPVWISLPARRVLETLRSVPEVVWGLIFVTGSILGPAAGIAALGLHSAGSLGRLFAESFDNVAAGPVRAISATGARRVSTALFALLPMALPTLAVHALFRLEWNVRAATVVGIIGAGGVGEAIFHAMQLFFYREMVAYILVTALLVAAVDFASSRLRHALGLTEIYA